MHIFIKENGNSKNGHLWQPCGNWILVIFLFFRYSGVFKLYFLCSTWRISSFDNACAHAALYQSLTNFSRWVPVLLTLLNIHLTTHHRKETSTKPTLSTKLICKSRYRIFYWPYQAFSNSLLTVFNRSFMKITTGIRNWLTFCIMYISEGN